MTGSKSSDAVASRTKNMHIVVFDIVAVTSVGISERTAKAERRYTLLQSFLCRVITCNRLRTMVIWSDERRYSITMKSVRYPVSFR